MYHSRFTDGDTEAQGGEGTCMTPQIFKSSLAACEHLCPGRPLSQMGIQKLSEWISGYTYQLASLSSTGRS